jgi:hypothetical protein
VNIIDVLYILYENRKIKPVEIILNREEGEWWWE